VPNPLKLPPPLLYASTHHSADILYFGGVEMHDPFIAFGDTRGRRITVQSPLELGRVKRTSRFHTILPLDACRERAQQRFTGKVGTAEIIATLAKEYKIRRFRIPADFPTHLYLKLTGLGIKLTLAEGMLFPEREIKTDHEVTCIREGNRLCAVGFAVAEGILRASRIRGRQLFYRGQVVTSENLRCAIETAILGEGGSPQDTIVAGGDQACDPHERGSGPLRPHELIIIDIFPRVTANGYHGDMTRTYLKGRPREVQRRLVATVREGQKLALKAIRAGVVSSTVHEIITECFAEAGYETRHGKQGSVGFFHGTGHGLGLEVHDPGVGISSRVSAPLKEGSVLTVEPGLYYPGLGGCRWEDVVQVTRGAPRMLSHHPYNWEIR